MASSWGTAAAAEMRRAWPAYTPPSSGSTSRSTTSSPSRAADQVADRDVVGHLGRGLRRGAGEAVGAEHAARRELVEVEGHAHQRARQRPQRTARPDPRRRRRWGGPARRRARRPGRGPPGRRASIASAPTSTGSPATSARAELAADLRRRLEQQHVASGGGEPAGRDQAGDPATDHHHVPRHGRQPRLQRCGRQREL